MANGLPKRGPSVSEPRDMRSLAMLFEEQRRLLLMLMHRLDQSEAVTADLLAEVVLLREQLVALPRQRPARPARPAANIVHLYYGK